MAWTTEACRSLSWVSRDPVVPGLILSQPLPQPPSSYPLPGIQNVTREERIETSCAQIFSWIASRALSAVEPLAEA